MTGVSVIVRTRNAANTIGNCLRSLLDQDYRDYEIIIVDDGSLDDTIRIVEEYGVKVLRNTSGRNPCSLGIEEARGGIVAFIDNDCVAERDWLARIMKYFGEDERLAGVGGEELAPATSNYWPRCFEALRRIEKKLLFHWGSLERISTCNVAYRRDALVEVGGFSDHLFYGEETELNWRLTKSNWKLRFEPELMVLHNRRSTLRKYFRQQFSTELGVGRVIRMHPGFLKPSHLATVALLLVPVLLLALLFSGSWVLALYLMGILIIFSTAVSSYAALAIKDIKLIPGILIASIIFVVARCTGWLAGLAISPTSPRYR